MRFVALSASAVLLASAVGIGSPIAFASTIYTYTGLSYGSASVPYTTSEKVSGTFTLNTPLAANLSNATVTPVSFSFGDGVQTITDQTAFMSLFGSISTNGSGAITGYAIQIQNLTGGYIKLNDVSGFMGDSVRLSVGNGATSSGAGMFTSSAVAATPEPSSLALLATGLLGVAGAVRGRRQA